MSRQKSSQPPELSRKILDFIILFQQQRGYAPSIREIGKQFGIESTSHIDYHLKALERFGMIERDSGCSRAIRVINKTARRPQGSLRSLPILGRIRAGSPVPIPGSDLALFDPESSIEVSTSQLSRNPEKNFALEVEGDSMIDAMISDGDIVILEQVSEVRNGDLVAAWLKEEGETTLKYYYLENGKVRLQPANPDYQPIIVDPENVEIQGRLVTVIRQVPTRSVN